MRRLHIPRRPGWWLGLAGCVLAVGVAYWLEHRPLEFTVVAAYPHDPTAFTQGLVYADGWLYEGTGRHGRSVLRRVALESGRVAQQVELEERYFGEGIAVLGERIYQLTWKARTGFVYDRRTFTELARFEYPTEGWGLTHDGHSLIMSDGSARLYYLDPESFDIQRVVEVHDGLRRVSGLNELEHVHGHVLANVFRTTRIVFVRLEDGRVVAEIDVGDLLQRERDEGPVNVANGIAHDADTDRLFVTGKLWRRVYEIEVEDWPGGQTSP